MSHSWRSGRAGARVLVSDDEGIILEARTGNDGVLVRDCSHTLVLSPPLVMTEAEAREVVSAVRSVVERLAPDGSIAPA